MARLCCSTIVSQHAAVIFLLVFTRWVCASEALFCASAASTMFYKANRKIFSAKVNIRCVITEDVA